MLYNIWMGINIVYEMLLPLLWLVVLLALAWGLTLVLALKRAPKTQWRRSLPITALVGLAAAALTFVFVPVLTHAGFSDLYKFIDWMFLIGTALAIGAVVMVATWPGLTWLKKA